MKSICVYCGSSSGKDAVYLNTAIELGTALADRKIKLVYGGARIGVMGHVADSCLKKGGEVLGVIPEFLDKTEVSHSGLTELVMTKSMHERKTIMAERAEGFIALPGGFGTLEELAEILTWSQLGLISKPIGILNVAGYYDNLLAMFETMLDSGFIKSSNLALFEVDETVEGLLQKMEAFKIIKTSYKEKLGLT
ncbi:MAG: TIGR00730 family Rossman fold protein [Reichenbachiella sp.]